MASAATAVPVRSKKAKNRPPRSNSSSDTESANSIGPDSDEEAGPPIILEDVAPSEKLKTKKVKKASEKQEEAEIEAEKKHKKHKKHKTADGEEKTEKHKKKHKEKSEKREKSSKKTKEASEASVGGKIITKAATDYL